MHTKLHVNVSQGIIDIEGDTKLVREIYTDFKDKLLNDFGNRVIEPDDIRPTTGGTAEKSKPKRLTPTQKRAKPKVGENGVDANKPQLDKNLDTSQLAPFYNQFEPQNHAERILIFAKFLTDSLDIDEINADQIYTCYVALKEKIPEAFSQSFRNAHGRRYGYIEYESSSNIKVTTKGENHFNNGIKRKTTE